MNIEQTPHSRDGKRRDVRMTLSTDSNNTERLINPIQTLAKSNQITFWTRRKSCHPSSRDPVRISPALSLILHCLHPTAAVPLFQKHFPHMTSACIFQIWMFNECFLFLFFFKNLQRTSVLWKWISKIEYSKHPIYMQITWFGLLCLWLQLFIPSGLLWK